MTPTPEPPGDAFAMPMAVTPGVLGALEIRGLLGRNDPLLLDVGANCGQTTTELLAAMPAARIHAFEPDPRAIARFRRSVASRQVTLYELAVGAHNGTATFHQSSGGEHLPGYESGWDQSGSIRAPRSHLQVWPWVRFDRRIEVPIVRLDDWAERQGIGNVDMIWADVQGAERDLIEGARNLLRRTRYFYTEYSDSEWYEGQVNLAALAAMLPDFRLVRRYPMDALFRHRFLA